ncbi:C-X-C chemokine receptor type 4 [Callorhinchus milii]|uniref:Chemokine receptor n=1 Tax=Callorhinchus milii TaxID=7868 RepID=K4G7X4_CALMI|nr:C-X-C chemokine receptor type 4 [Callorhinchus milii]AFM88361.1 chemokine receptor [Callorhinchus milii]|eukprot:gi/632957302/ref/XP_007894404.1/ PREDICTED: C-X-C chemokine receptor type 4 [Callorhinchus milii]
MTDGTEYLMDELNYEHNDSANYSYEGEFMCEEQNLYIKKILIPLFYSLIFILGIVGNGLVVLVMGYHKRYRSMTDKYRLHLSVADLLFVLTLPFWAIDTVNWYFGDITCKIVHVIYTMNLYSTVLIMAFISLDRYYAVVHATNSTRQRKMLANRFVYVGVWLPSILLTVPDMVFAKTTQLMDRIVCDRIYPTETFQTWLVAFRMKGVLVGFVLPALVILTCYCIIISKLSQSTGLQKRKALKITIILIVIFFTCWLPYYIVILIDTVMLMRGREYSCVMEQMVIMAMNLTEAVAYCHCCLNPILYAFVGVNFKSYTRKVFSHSEIRCSPLKKLQSKDRRATHPSISTESESSSLQSSC